MSNLKLKLVACAILPLMFGGCAPLVPDNYLSPSRVRTPQKLNGKWIEPRFIPISAQFLNSNEGQELLKPALEPQPYHVGSYDNLNIIVWGHPELSTVATQSTPSIMPNMASMPSSLSSSLASLSAASNPAILVETDGTIFYPYVGRLKVAGLSVNEIQVLITQRLSNYLRNPQVSVQVAKFRNRNSFVLGEVKTPGMQPLTDKPLTLMEAISNAGGINSLSADPTHIYLIRGNYQRPDVFWLNAQTPQSLMIAEQFPLQENDIVYVSAATFNSWNNLIQTVLPTFSTYYTIKGLS
jgi:polysaccharide export outer membrane protein